MYPLQFVPIIKKMVWGSESWDISCRNAPGEMSIIANGELAGEPFDKVIAQNSVGWLGTKASEFYQKNGFPLLVKIIDAKDDLSIQVHPNDEYALANGFERGKSEMWYIMQAKSDQNLIIGLTDDATPQKLQNAPLDCLNRLPIKKGDMIDIPAGMVHAITSGVKLAEIQQNCDVTFRLYDYNRLGLDGLPRQLHIKDGIAVSDFANKFPKTAVKNGVVQNQYFSVVKREIKKGINSNITQKTNPKTFFILTCVEGSFTVLYENYSLELPCGRSVFIPPSCGSFAITGTGVFLESSVATG
ncbi:MAG: class I mannose-6-phosphate isomerase [Defluviitaleaceae bacterium]|nr:class I mannose-6-phosphate isomerase [Defluviitaleaceae bacterium]